MCGGACRVDAHSVNGSMNADDPCADYTNLPIKFKYPSDKVFEFTDDERFLLNENFKVIKETFGMRVIIGEQNAFVTDEFYSFIDNFRGKIF